MNREAGNGGGIGTAMAEAPQPRTMGDWLRDHKNEIQQCLPRGADAGTFMRSFMQEYRRVPKLAECDANSVSKCFLELCQLGLRLGPQDHAHLVPFGAECTVILGYRGLLDLARRSGEIKSIHAEVVYDKDEFQYSLGLNPDIRHTPTEEEDPGALRYAYAVFHYMNGGHHFVVMPRREVLKIKAAAPGSGNNKSPWKVWEAEQWKKTALRRGCKYAPVGIEYQEALTVEDARQRFIDMPVAPEDAPKGTKTRVADLAPPTEQPPTAQEPFSDPAPTATEPEPAKPAPTKTDMDLSKARQDCIDAHAKVPARKKPIGRVAINECKSIAQLETWTAECKALWPEQQAATAAEGGD